VKCLSRLPVLLGIGILCLAAGLALSRGDYVSASQLPSDPGAACASCHRDIYERYRKTPMANASGAAVDGVIPADFYHAPSGVHYKVFAESGRVWLTYMRENAPPAHEPNGHELNGRDELLYYIGSGRRGRTYLFERQGYWFESPINWYTKKHVWDMAPNFLSAKEAPLALPVDPDCLRCHASNVQPALKDARNRFAGEPFARGGIACSSCHGDATAHVASAGKVHLPNIGAMEPLRRDSICLNCHLEGQAAVIRQGKQLAAFTAGDDLFDYALFFVYSGENGSGGRATSQWEALLRSECKRQSGDKLTCTTCHDPHGSPSPQERTAFYRQRCLACHSQPAFAQTHHPENQDCTACHMGRPASNDIAHEQVTDHWIRKRANEDRLPTATSGDLVAVGGFAASDRDLGLAYAQMAARGDQKAAPRALDLLERAEREGGPAHDHELQAQLGFLKQVAGQIEPASVEYKKALEADPDDSLAAGNLALIEATHHEPAEAKRLWRSVFSRDPLETAAGMNLAVVECGSGQRAAAVDTLSRILQFSPDHGRARAMLEAIQSGRRSCEAR
jgi:predicted CXXCH cytochrome family protein